MAIISNESYLRRSLERAQAAAMRKVEVAARPPEPGRDEAGEVPDAQRTVLVSLSRVSEAQAAALGALVEGRTIVEAAAEAGVTRGTLYRWRTQDTQFKAALHAWRMESRAHARDRMLAMADKAIGAVASGLEKGDARLGLHVLKELASDQSGRVQADDPIELAVASATPAQRDAHRAAFGEVIKRMTPEQMQRVPQILEMGLAVDNARIAAAEEAAAAGAASCGEEPEDVRGKPVEAGKGQTGEAASGESVDDAQGDTADGEEAAL